MLHQGLLFWSLGRQAKGLVAALGDPAAAGNADAGRVGGIFASTESSFRHGEMREDWGSGMRMIGTRPQVGSTLTGWRDRGL
jgi:hypothetical protein